MDNATAESSKFQSFVIDGREYKYELELDNQSKWKPIRLQGHHIVPGREIFETYEEARAEARKLNRARA